VLDREVGIEGKSTTYLIKRHPALRSGNSRSLRERMPVAHGHVSGGPGSWLLAQFRDLGVCALLAARLDAVRGGAPPIER